MQPTSWREERRRDRAAEAQIARDDAAMQAKLRLAQDQAARAERRATRKQRAARWGGLAAWVRSHLTDLLFVPVIAVPGTLAWSAMSAYGHDLFGVVGYALPAFSEGGMWVFEARATWIARTDPERPVWQLEIGAWAFAAMGAGLNFLHGITRIPGHPHGVIVGVVMAIISAAGLVAHQIVNLGPRRTRADRQAARLKRAAGRRAQAFRRTALRGAIASLDTDGNARVQIRPGTFTLTRHHGRARLETLTFSPVWLPWPMVLPGTAGPAAIQAFDMQAAEAVAAYRGWHSEFIAVPAPRVRQIAAPILLPPRPMRAVSLRVTPQAEPVLRQAEHSETPPPQVPQTSVRHRPAAASKPASGSASKRGAGKAQKTASKPSEKRREAERLVRDEPGITTADLVARTGVSRATAIRIRADAPRRLHVAGG